MPIRPIDLRRKEFKSGFRGYDANQVDDFLDEVADEFERAVAENGRMRDEIEVLRGRLQQFEELEGSIRAALVHAEQAAEDLRRSAHREADSVREAAQREAEFTIREAQERSHRLLADSSSRVERVEASYEALTKARREFANDFRHLMKTYLAVMDQAETASAREIEAALRDRMDTESIAVARRASETQEELGTPSPQQRDDITRIHRRETAESAAVSSGDEQGFREEAGPLGRATEDDDTTSHDELTSSQHDDAESQATQRIETPVTDDEPYGAASESGETAPEAEEPEVEASSAGRSPEEGVVYRSEGSEAADEVDREEGMPAGEDRTADGEGGRQGEAREGQQEDRKLFRASRFLRRRG